MRLMLWRVPRSRSTAFFRMMAERGDFTVVHEPFSYLVMHGHTDVGRPPSSDPPEHALHIIRNFLAIQFPLLHPDPAAPGPAAATPIPM
jgi:hypothetical protein